MPKRSAWEPPGSRERGESLWGNFMGQCTGGLALGAKAKGNSTGREQRRHALRGESLWGDICGGCVGVRGHKGFVNGKFTKY